jgi:hypothetical protein
VALNARGRIYSLRAKNFSSGGNPAITPALQQIEAPRGEKSVEAQYDADYWRKRADEAHSVALAMADPAAKRHMHFIAQAYERLADHAERTARRKRGT